MTSMSERVVGVVVALLVLLVVLNWEGFWRSLGPDVQVGLAIFLWFFGSPLLMGVYYLILNVSLEWRHPSVFEFYWSNYLEFPGLLHRIWDIVRLPLSITIVPLFKLILMVLSPLLASIEMGVTLDQAKRRIEGEITEAVAEVEEFDQELSRRYR